MIAIASSEPIDDPLVADYSANDANGRGGRLFGQRRLIPRAAHYRFLGESGDFVEQTFNELPETWYPGKNVYVAVKSDPAVSEDACWSGLDELGFEHEPRLTYAELRGSDKRAARCLAEAHRDLAASLPLDSRVRALALRCGDHWGRLAGLPHGLTKVER